MKSNKNFAHDVARLGGTALREKDIPELNAGTARVLKLLKDGQWHSPAEILAAAQGSEWLRRLRDLRAQGFDIRKKRAEDGRTFLYRLVKVEQRGQLTMFSNLTPKSEDL